MAKPPFRINQPPARNVNSTTEAAKPPAGHYILKSEQTGDPLPAPSTSQFGPEKQIPWPAAGGPDDRKPFKI